MITRNDLIDDSDKRSNYARGALAGLALGDSFGDACRTEKNHKKYGITMDFGPESSWSTDDTEFALLTAKILIDTDGEPKAEDVAAAWREHVVSQNELNRGGGSEIEAAYNLRKGMNPPDSGKYNFYHMSDGAAMRIAPIGIVYAGDPKKAAEIAKIDSEISHWRDGIWGAQAVAAAVAVAMVNGTVDQIIEAALEYAPEDSWFRKNLVRGLEIVESKQPLKVKWTKLHDELRSEYKAAVPEAIAQAFSLFKLFNGELEQTLIYSGNFGRDADTIGAVIGALCGALHGIDEIPKDWVNKARYPTGTCLEFTDGIDILDYADSLALLIK